MVKKYAKVEDKKTGAVSVGEGTNTEFYKSIGMKEMEVEQAYDGSWYVKGKAPEKPQETVYQEELYTLEEYLNHTDWYCARFVDSGVEIPEEVKIKRAQARTRIDELREILK